MNVFNHLFFIRCSATTCCSDSKLVIILFMANIGMGMVLNTWGISVSMSDSTMTPRNPVRRCRGPPNTRGR